MRSWIIQCKAIIFSSKILQFKQELIISSIVKYSLKAKTRKRKERQIEKWRFTSKSGRGRRGPEIQIINYIKEGFSRKIDRDSIVKKRDGAREKEKGLVLGAPLRNGRKTLTAAWCFIEREEELRDESEKQRYIFWGGIERHWNFFTFQIRLK